MQRALCWLRRDLRLYDHVALAAATHEADEVAVVFVFDSCILEQLQDRDDRRLTFIFESLKEIDVALQKHNSRLIVLHGDPTVEIPMLAEKLSIDAVFTNRDYEPYALKRDAKVGELLGSIDFRTFKDTIALEPTEVRTKGCEPFKVFSPFQRCWRSVLDHERDLHEHRPDPHRLMAASKLENVGLKLHLEAIGFTKANLWLEPGERAGRARLKEFIQKVKGYKTARNVPAKDGVSGLSVHLRFGTVSVRDCYRRAFAEGSSGAQKWITELIWREFYQHILFHYPHVVDEPFQRRFSGLKYPGKRPAFKLWCEGRTGFPLVDAAMRAFNSTGYMHNRLRMLTSSFLTKDLLVNYRFGEAYFARYLLDFELASNNGGWQWSASVGVDPNPWFRIINPVLQSEKFDPDGSFIKEWIPELRELEAKYIHAPWEAPEFELLQAGVELGKTYPEPIVDHKEQRQLALALLQSAHD